MVQAKGVFRFYREAKTKFNVHSPFLYELLTGVLDISKEFYPFSTLEEARKDLLHDHRKIAVKDYGAGSQVMKDNVREVCRIASTSLSNPRKCRVLFNLANHYKCTQVLELGTSLGLSSAYMGSANRNYTQYTYDAENRLTKVEDFVAGNSTPAFTSTYRYDGLGRRIEKVANGQTKRYIYDGEDILLEYDGSNVLQARYTHGPGIGEPIAVTKGADTFFYHQDGLGSVTDLTDSAGVTTKSYA